MTVLERYNFPDGFVRRDEPAKGTIDEVRFVDTLVRNADVKATRHVPAGCSLYLRGWAVVPTPPRLARAVLATIGDDVVIDLLYGRARPDIAAFFKVEEVITSGFHAVYPLGDLPLGRHTLRIVTLDESDGYHELPHKETFEIVPSKALWTGKEPAAYERLHISLDSALAMRSGALLQGKALAIERGDIVVVKGWAVDRADAAGAAAVFAIVDGEEYVLGVPGLPRDDVAQTLAMPGARRCGFSLRLPTRTYAPGPHKLEIAAVAADGAYANMYAGTLEVT